MMFAQSSKKKRRRRKKKNDERKEKIKGKINKVVKFFCLPIVYQKIENWQNKN